MWSTKEFPTRVMFGPYGGEILPILGQEKSSGYAWQVGVVRPEFFDIKVDLRDFFFVDLFIFRAFFLISPKQTVKLVR